MQTATLYTDPELSEVPLDMGRPELATLMKRYVPSAAPQAATTTEPREVLVVRGASGDESAVIEALGTAGWEVSTCSGPATGSCPLMHGKDCTLRKTADVALVYLDATGMWPGSGTLPRIRCAADPASPAVVALEGSHRPAAYGSGRATIGAKKSPVETIATINTLCATEKNRRGIRR